jgi:hypothetical protein
MTDHTSNVNVAKEILALKKRNFLVGSTSQFKDDFRDLKKTGVDYVYNYYDRLGADFAEHFVNYSKNKLEELPFEDE